MDPLRTYHAQLFMTPLDANHDTLEQVLERPKVCCKTARERVVTAMITFITAFLDATICTALTARCLDCPAMQIRPRRTITTENFMCAHASLGAELKHGTPEKNAELQRELVDAATAALRKRPGCRDSIINRARVARTLQKFHSFVSNLELARPPPMEWCASYENFVTFLAKALCEEACPILPFTQVLRPLIQVQPPYGLLLLLDAAIGTQDGARATRSKSCG